MSTEIRNLQIEHDHTGENIVRICFEFGPGYQIEAQSKPDGTWLHMHRPDLTISLNATNKMGHYERALNLLSLHLR